LTATLHFLTTEESSEFKRLDAKRQDGT
jgi:hypothetical protein